MDASDLAVRQTTYGLVVELGRVPARAEVASRMGIDDAEVRAAWLRLHDAHALVLDPVTDEIRMANPFSAIATPYAVDVAGRSWWANCAWDAFGICAALQADGRIETACPDCGTPIVVDVQGGRPSDDSLLFHCLVPAARWWEDIVFT